MRQGTSVFHTRQRRATEPVSLGKFSLLQVTAQDEQPVGEQRGLAAPKRMERWDQNVMPRRVGAGALPTRNWHAMQVSS